MFEPGSFLSLKRTVEHGAMIKRGAHGDKKEKPNEPDRRPRRFSDEIHSAKGVKEFFPGRTRGPGLFYSSHSTRCSLWLAIIRGPGLLTHLIRARLSLAQTRRSRPIVSEPPSSPNSRKAGNFNALPRTTNYTTDRANRVILYNKRSND